MFKLCILVMFFLIVLPSTSQAKSDIESAGDIVQLAIPTIAYTTTFIYDDSEGRTQFYKSFGLNLALTYSLKYAVNSPRPEGNGGQSFPSGHTSAAFQGAAFLHRRYGLEYGLPAYIAATFVGWSRVEGESDKHRWSDIAAGAALGVATSYYFTTNKMIITPSINDKKLVLYMQVEW